MDIGYSVNGHFSSLPTTMILTILDTVDWSTSIHAESETIPAPSFPKPTPPQLNSGTISCALATLQHVYWVLGKYWEHSVLEYVANYHFRSLIQNTASSKVPTVSPLEHTGNIFNTCLFANYWDGSVPPVRSPKMLSTFLISPQQIPTILATFTVPPIFTIKILALYCDNL